MNHSIIPGFVLASAGQHSVDHPLCRAHGFRQEAHPQSHGQRYAEYHLGHQPTHGHRDGHLRNEYAFWNQSTACCWLTLSRIPPPSIRPHPAAPWETFHNAAERRDIWTNKTHEKSNKNLNVEVLRPTNIQEIRTVPAHASIKHVSPVHTERPVQVFGLEYTGKDKFHCHHIKSPELEQKKVNRVANLSDDEADGLWSEIEDLLHHMSPKPHNHPPGGHEIVNNTALQGPFMRRDDMPPRIQENLTKASRLPPQAPLAGPSIAAYHSESLHPDIICTIRALREEPWVSRGV